MRTTVEITDEQRQALMALASRRGIRGFSPLVQEAIDVFLTDRSSERIGDLMALEGSLSATEADEVQRRIADAWSTWPTAS